MHLNRIRWAGFGCVAGGVLFTAINLTDVLGLTQLPAILFTVVGALLLIGLTGGPLGLLMLRAAGNGRTGRTGTIGAVIALLGLVSYLLGVVVTLAVPEFGVFYLLGALLSGLGMLVQGSAVATARQLGGWLRWSAVLVGLYYIVMIPIQVVFFIVPNGQPSALLLAGWGVTWALLGLAIVTSTRTINRTSAPSAVAAPASDA